MKKFQVPEKLPKQYTTTNKSIRFPNDVIQRIEKAIREKDCSFSAFVVAAVEHALEDVEEQEP